MLNKNEKQTIVICTKDLYRLALDLSGRGYDDEVEIVQAIIGKLEGLLDD